MRQECLRHGVKKKSTRYSEVKVEEVNQSWDVGQMPRKTKRVNSLYFEILNHLSHCNGERGVGSTLRSIVAICVSDSC